MSAAFQSDRISLNNCNLESVESVAQSKRTDSPSIAKVELSTIELGHQMDG